MRGHDPDEQIVLSGRPGPQVASFPQVPELAWLQHPVRLAADQHAPEAEVMCRAANGQDHIS
jgi:hypothetical protein